MRQRAASHLRNVAVLVHLLAACSQSHGPRSSARPEDTGEESDDAGVKGGEDSSDAPSDGERGCGDYRDNDCPEDSFCHGELACGSLWKCYPRSGSAGPKPPSCSALAPQLVCGCDGYVQSRAVGCPHDRFATLLEPQFLGAMELTSGERVRCDPARKGRYPMTYRVHARGFEAYEGKKVYWFLGLAARPELAGIQVSTVEGGGFEQTLGPFDGGEPHRVPFFVDVDGDGRCEGDPDPTTPALEQGGEPVGYARRSGLDLVEAFYAYTLEPLSSVETRFCERFALTR